MRIGILGTGMGAYHASIYKELKDVESIFIYGRNEEKLKKVKEEVGIKTTNCVEDIISNPDIDLVDICLPSQIHKQYAIEALRNGKHVFCETPVSLNIDDAIAMRDAAKRYNKKLFVDMFIKHEPPYEFLYDAINQGSYGKLKALHIKRKTPPLWGDLGLSNITTNLMIHEIDFITWLLGTPNDISVSGMSSKVGQSHIAALLNYDDTIVEIQGSSMMPEYHPFTVGYEAIFEDGTVEFIENGYVNRTEKSLIVFTNSGKEEIETSQKNCYEESIKDVLQCCEKNTSTRLDISDAIESLKIAIKIKDILLNN